MCDTYNGWTNQETWSMDLWLSNDAGLYEMVNERISGLEGWKAGDAIESFVEELLDPDEQLMSTDNIITLLKDVGSLYRVNWEEIAEAFLAA